MSVGVALNRPGSGSRNIGKPPDAEGSTGDLACRMSGCPFSPGVADHVHHHRQASRGRRHRGRPDRCHAAAALADTAAPPAKAASGLGLRKSGGNSASGVMQRAGPQLRVVRRRTPPYSRRAPASPSSRSSRAPPAAPFRPTIIGPSRGESPLGAVASLWRVPAKTAFGRRTRETGWRGRKPLAKSKNGSPPRTRQSRMVRQAY